MDRRRKPRSLLALLIVGLVLFRFAIQKYFSVGDNATSTFPSLLLARDIVHNESECQKLVDCQCNNETPTDFGHNYNSKVEVEVGAIFMCGWPCQGLARVLFPDYVRNGLETFDNRSRSARVPDPRDILVHGVFGPCRHNPLEFPGKVLMIHGETRDPDQVGALLPRRNNNVRSPHHAVEGVYQLGMIPDTPHSILAYYGPMMMWNVLPQEAPNLLNIQVSHKPKNTGEYHAIVYITSNCVAYREEAIARLSKIIPAHYGGKCQGNPGGNIREMPDIQHMRPKKFLKVVPFYNKYKFCMVMENSYVPLYLTEKLVLAFLGGCIPIYYGASAFDIFNPRAFVFYNISNPQPALDQMQLLSTNQTAYNEMLHNEPVLLNGADTVRDFFSFSDEFGGGHVKHRLRRLMGIE